MEARKTKIIDGKKRYWYGTVRALSDNPKLCSLKIGFCILKPDLIDRGLKNEVMAILGKELNVCLERSFVFNDELIFDLYPGFHEPKWAWDLRGYLTAGPSCVILLYGENPISKLVEIKSLVRQMYKVPSYSGNIINLMHTPDSPENTLKEALLFFKEEEIINAVVMKEA